MGLHSGRLYVYRFLNSLQILGFEFIVSGIRESRRVNFNLLNNY